MLFSAKIEVMNDIRLRDYQNADWARTLAMLVQTMEYHISIQQPKRFKTYTMNLMRNYLRELTGKHKTGKGKLILAVDADDQAIGFIYGQVDEQDKELAKSAVKSGTLVELFVSADSRGKKVAQQLMKGMEEYLKAKGCVLIRLKDVHQTNQPAQKLYAKLGYMPRVIEFAKEIL